MTPFEKLTGVATTVVLVAGIVAAVTLSGADGVTARAHGDPGTGGATPAPSVTSEDTGGAAAHDGPGARSAPGAADPSGLAAPEVDGTEVATDPDHSAPTSRTERSRVSTTTSYTDVIDLLEQVLSAGDLDALTDLLDSLDPSVLDDVLDQLEGAIETGTIEQLVDDLLGDADLPAPTTLPPLTVPDATVPAEDPTGAVDDVVDDTAGTVDDVLEDPTGTVDDTIGSITGSTGGDDTTGTVDDTTEPVTETVTDTVDGLL